MEDKKVTLGTTYNPKDFEEKLIKYWKDENFYKAEIDFNKKPYTIIMPPPNITGKLHIGHALDDTLQDIIIRFKRMQGYSALWLPGQDHASIATEIRVEKHLKDQGIDKKEIGREEFLKHTWKWANEYREKIKEQVDKLGASVDYSREAFTMDENVSRAVRHVFVKLYNDGLIYKGDRITNWCPHCKTAISDVEIEYEESEGYFWHINYPVKDSAIMLEIATTRPETMLGDTAVAVHPEDERYKDLIGKTVILPIVGREIPVIADEYVDREFGTGIVKITPAHDPNDYKVGLRHNLKEISIMDEAGYINGNGGKFKGQERYEARKNIIAELKDLGLLVKERKITHNVSKHEKCSTTIEPLISSQWYVKMNSLAKPAIDAIRKKKINFIPERMEKTYYNWMENIQDWCISRQLWWGHRIPVWYCDDCNEIIVSETTPDTCPKCGKNHLTQDKDVLDTWFSSALWPFSTLGWPDKTEDFKYFYPTSTLVTGHDIIFFWVARMIFSALYNTEDIPFDTVLFHGIVRDENGIKMSKSLGNGVDPLEVIDKYGADALRYMLSTGNTPGNDMRYIESKVESSRNFANKIWNASRYTMMNLDKDLMEKYKNSKNYTLADKWILHRNNEVIKEVTENLEKFEIGIAMAKIYDFLWTELCDWYIELTKPVLYGEDEEKKATAMIVLNKVLKDGLKLLHPAMPFITEEIYMNLTGEKTISLASWPISEEENDNRESKEDMEIIIESIKSIRNLRQEMNVHPTRKATTYVIPKENARRAFNESQLYLEKLGFASSVVIREDKKDLEKMVSLVVPGGEILLPILDLIDKNAEIERLKKEIEKLKKEVARVDGKLSNEKFISKAPEKVINEEKDKKAAYQGMLDKVMETLKETENL